MIKKTGAQLFVTDMDGTLLGNDKRIPAANLEAIKLLQKKGIPLVICTGRPLFMVRDYIRQTHITAPVICCNGALIQEIHTGKVLFGKYFSPQVIKKIVDFCLAEKMDFLAYDPQTVYHQEFSKRIEIFMGYNTIAREGGTEEIPFKHIAPYYEPLTSGAFPVHKALIVEYHGNDLEKAWHFLNAHKDLVYAVPSMDNVIDLMPAGVSKGEAVTKIAELMNIPLEQTCVIGDHKNDVSMLQIAGFSVCMASGEEAAKQAAHYVTKKTNNEGGFAEAVDRYIELNAE